MALISLSGSFSQLTKPTKNVSLCLLIIFSFPLYFLRSIASQSGSFPWHAEHVLPWAGHCLGMCFRPQRFQSNILLSGRSSVRFPLGLETARTVALSLTAVAPISLKVLTCCCDNSHAWQICIAPSSKRSVSLSSHSLTFLTTTPKAIWSQIIESRSVAKLHVRALRFRSVKNDLRNCWILKRKIYLSYVSFFLGEQRAWNFSMTTSNFITWLIVYIAYQTHCTLAQLGALLL